MQATSPHLLRPLTLALALALASLGSAAQNATPPVAAAQPQPLNIAAQAAPQALQQLMDQTKLQLIYSPDLLRGVTTKAVNGSFTPMDALARMLEGTGLQAVGTGVNAATIRPTVPAPDRPARVEALDTVMISATRRREPVREIPLQVSVLQGEALERSGARSLADYIAGQPGVNLTDSGGLTAALSIRGVTTGQQTVATVGVYVDDVATGSSGPYSAGAATPLSMGLLDLHHIEILRGPQGTLYGAGAMGGVLKYVTNEPETDAFSGKVMLGASSTRDGGIGWTTSAVVNAPIKKNVAALRVAAFHDKFGGYIDAVGPAAAKDVNSGKTDGVRIALLLTPARGLAVRLSATAQNMSRDGLGLEDLDPATHQLVEGDLKRRLFTPEPFTNRTRLYGIDVEYDFGGARLNAITSAQDTSIDARIDASRALLPLLTGAGMPSESVVAKSRIDQHRVSQELRLTSRADRSLEWLAGLYVTRERASTNGGADATRVGGAQLNLLTSSLPSTYKEAAAYGDITWHATPALALTGGLRLAHNSQRYDDISSGLLAGAGTKTQGSSSETSTTYLATAKYALSRTSNVYFRAASGYRPGGPNGLKPSADLSVVKPAFESDSLWSYELGYKADLLDRSLSLEAALYDVEWKNIQQPIKSGAFSYNTNGGSARVRGAELALNWLPSKTWHFHATAAAIDAKLTSDAPGLQAKAGVRMPVTARFSMTAGGQYLFSLADRPAYAGLNLAYVGERDAGYSGSTSLPSFKLPAYTQVDLQAGIDFKRFSLAAYVRNLTDQRGLIYPGTGDAKVRQVTVTAPRTVGLSVSVPY
ncbi:TonB-dependent receptor domain-containing protein [Roseateles toxinivorans]|uniref:Outer membrane receptor protein involved in Fe transport n=1 Tax=Roseateles toxinivorans TaxID=270368 RepID=A0A4R6QR63_9BURK|nr:TonB-dependent receptor [Roseateles toxinivorans]TDP71784.1 outer membrane receptor protein involved in Fe transport [Roseateles toxinivorans]